MSRSFFQGWGAALDDTRFACALAWIGTRPFSGREGHDGGRFTLPWFIWRTQPERESADAAAKAWLDAASEMPRNRIALEVHQIYGPFWMPWPTNFDPAWLVETLMRAEGVTSVSFVQHDRVERAWDWPLDIAFFSDPASQALRANLAPPPWPNFVRFVEANATDAAIDLLLFPGSLSEALAAVAMAPRIPPVHTVLALGGAGRTRDIYVSLTALRTEAGALASGVIDIPVERAREWLDRLLLKLSRDRALDEALFAATSDYSRTPPILVAREGAFAAARTALVAVEVGRKLAFAPLDQADRIVPMNLRKRFGLADNAPLQEVSEHLQNSAETLDWVHETDTATALSELAGTLRSQIPFPDGRFVQAKVYAGNRVLDNAPLVPGKVHRIDVRIARGGEGWSSTLEEFPNNELPPSAHGHELTVVFIAPSVLSEPQSTRLWLPTRGDSESCSFHFLVKDGLSALDARVMILFENRLLQTLRLQARVSGGSEKVPALSLALESVLRTRLDDLSSFPGFDVSILLNDLEASRGIAAIAGSKVAYVSVSSNIGELLKSLRDELERIKKSPEDFQDPRGEATRILLVTLARAGASFLKNFRELPGMREVLSSVGDAPGRIQIMSMHPDEIAPLEFIYDRALPRVTAKFCEGMAPHGHCGPSCSRDNDTICPLGFWGIRHIIERRLYDETIAEELQARGAAFSIGSEICEHRSMLQPLRSVLFSSAQRAANFDKISFDSTITQIDKMLRDKQKRFVPVQAWDDWKLQVKEMHPELLLLLAHTEMQMGAGVLEIGSAEFLAAADLETEHVREPPAAPPEAGPIVFLLGCRTALEEVPFSSFVAAFRQARASVVIATMSTVRGRHMAPVAEEAVRLILERAHGQRCTIGELIRELRLSLLVKGLPVGLTLVAFGDVDWQIGGIK